MRRALLLSILLICLPSEALAQDGPALECAAARRKAVQVGQAARRFPGGEKVARAAMEKAVAFCRQRVAEGANASRRIRRRVANRSSPG